MIKLIRAGRSGPGLRGGLGGAATLHKVEESECVDARPSWRKLLPGAVTSLASRLLVGLILIGGTVQLEAAERGGRQSSVADVVVLDQHDQTRRFYSDLVEGRVVAVNFIFTRCTMVCPIMGAGFAQVQTLLGERGSDVGLISISIDPATDDPARLLAWSQQFGAKPGWTLVTGNKPEIDALLTSLGTTSADPVSHAPQVLIIDDREPQNWQRIDGLSNPALIATALLDRLEPDAGS